MKLPEQDEGSPRRWLQHAASDLRLAALAAGDEKVLPEQACFHAQQAAEKAIKAALLARGLEFPHSHDIELLIEIAERAGLKLPAEAQEASSLTPFAVAVRYPGGVHDDAPVDAAAAIRTAAAVVTWAEQVVGD